MSKDGYDWVLRGERCLMSLRSPWWCGVAQLEITAELVLRILSLRANNKLLYFT